MQLIQCKISNLNIIYISHVQYWPKLFIYARIIVEDKNFSAAQLTSGVFHESASLRFQPSLFHEGFESSKHITVTQHCCIPTDCVCWNRPSWISMVLQVAHYPCVSRGPILPSGHPVAIIHHYFILFFLTIYYSPHHIYLQSKTRTYLYLLNLIKWFEWFTMTS